MFNLIYLPMKLFITNKKEFEEKFDDLNFNSHLNYLSSGEIHKKAFSKLFTELSNGYIPLVILQEYGSGEGCCIFNFVNRKEEIYFYEYTGKVS